MTQSVERTIQGVIRPTLIIFTGTTYGFHLCNEFRTLMQERFGRVPPWLHLMVVDTDIQSSSQDGVRFFPLGKVDLPEMKKHPSLHPEVEATLAQIPLNRVPSTLDSGSQKVTAFTLAAFQARWAEPDGLRQLLQQEVASLQAGRVGIDIGYYQVFITGLICGGVGGIAPLLMAAAMRTLGETNPSFGA